MFDILQTIPEAIDFCSRLLDEMAIVAWRVTRFRNWVHLVIQIWLESPMLLEHCDQPVDVVMSKRIACVASSVPLSDVELF